MISLESKPILTPLRAELAQQVTKLIASGVEPHLAAVLVGDDEQSLRYIERKTFAAHELGIIFSVYHLEAGMPCSEIEQTIKFLGADPEVHGIILQLPLPEEYSPKDIDLLIKAIPPAKDVDGLRGDWETLTFTQYSLESLLGTQPYALPPMIGSVCSILDQYKIDLEGKKIVIVGEGRLVGAPLSAFFKKLHFDVTVVDEHTKNIFDVTVEADVLITGTGQTDLITYQWIKEGATVINCSQDVHEDSVKQVAGALSPSVGGIGPLTVFWLLHNSYQAARNA